MDNKEDWKEIEEYLKIKDSEKLGEYGFDIKEELGNQIKRNKDPKRKMVKKVIKINFILALIVIIAPAMFIVGLFVYCYFDSVNHSVFLDIQKTIEDFTGDKIKLISKDVDKNDNGIYTFRVKNNKEIKIHATKRWGSYCEDAGSQYYKYYFEKWNDKDKDKFIVYENFAETADYTDKTKDWLLDYSTYIEASNYQEMLDAVEMIIRFLQYMNKPLVASHINSYIKIYGENMKPAGFYPAIYDQMRENAKLQYVRILKNNGMKDNNVPQEIYDKFDELYGDELEL